MKSTVIKIITTVILLVYSSEAASLDGEGTSSSSSKQQRFAELEQKISELRQELNSLKNSQSDIIEDELPEEDTYFNQFLLSKVMSQQEELIQFRKQVSDWFGSFSQKVCDELADSRRSIAECQNQINYVLPSLNKNSLDSSTNKIRIMTDSLKLQLEQLHEQSSEQNKQLVKKLNKLEEEQKKSTNDVYDELNAWFTYLNANLCSRLGTTRASIDKCVNQFKSMPKPLTEKEFDQSYQKLGNKINEQTHNMANLRSSINKQASALSEQIENLVGNQRNELLAIKSDVGSWLDPMTKQVCHYIAPTNEAISKCTEEIEALKVPLVKLSFLTANSDTTLTKKLADQKNELKSIVVEQSRQHLRQSAQFCEEMRSKFKKLNNQIEILRRESLAILDDQSKSLNELRDEVKTWFAQLSVQLCSINKQPLVQRSDPRFQLNLPNSQVSNMNIASTSTSRMDRQSELELEKPMCTIQ